MPCPFWLLDDQIGFLIMASNESNAGRLSPNRGRSSTPCGCPKKWRPGSRPHLSGIKVDGSVLGKQEKLRLRICNLMDSSMLTHMAAICYNLSMKTFCIPRYRKRVENQPLDACSDWASKSPVDVVLCGSETAVLADAASS